MAWQRTRKTNRQSAITEEERLEQHTSGEGSRKRGTSSRQVCGQSRDPETLIAMLRSILLVWGTG